MPVFIINLVVSDKSKNFCTEFAKSEFTQNACRY